MGDVMSESIIDRCKYLAQVAKTGVMRNALSSAASEIESNNQRIATLEASERRLLTAGLMLVRNLQHIREYWNQDQNETAMANALWHIIGECDNAIADAAAAGIEVK